MLVAVFYIHISQVSVATLLMHGGIIIILLRATAVPAGTAEARNSYGDSVCPSVRPSVTTRCRNNRVR